MKYVKLFEFFLNEGKEEWLELKPLNKDGLVDLMLELEYSMNGPFTISEVDEMEEKYKQETEEDLFELVSQALGCEPNEDSIIDSLMEIYPHGYILHHNNEFHQDGGLEDEDLDESLFEKMSKESQKWISKKIAKLKKEGKENDQAVAIAFSMAREEGFDVPDNPQK